MKILFVLSFYSALGIQSFHAQYVSRFSHVSQSSPQVNASPCQTYQCSTSRLNNNQCIFTSNSSNLLQACPEGSFCPWALSLKHNVSCVSGSTVIPYGGNPGDQCFSNSECGGLSTCNLQQNICVGRKTGQPCNDQGDCDVGYVCRNVDMAATCQPMVGLGQKCGDYLSMNLCLNNLTCNNGVCISLFSQSNGAIVSLWNANLACKSGFYKKGTQANTAICTAAPPSPAQSLPISCSAGSLCYSRDKQFTAPCECSFSAGGQGYCPLFPGDALYVQYFQAFQSYMTNPGVNQCHYLDLLMPTCPGIPYSQYEQLESLANEVQYYVAKIGNDRCVKELITYNYWFG